MTVVVSREVLAHDLWTYGEDDLAAHALKLSDVEMERVGVIASGLLHDDSYATASGASMLLAKACAMAAVEVMEGTNRPLAREPRRPVSEPPQAPAVEPPPGEEKPRDVFLAACAELARRFEARGFKYAKSGPRLSRRGGEFTFHISFSSSHYNVPGEHVDVTVYAGVRSKTLRDWRREHDPSEYEASESVAGGMLQNLTSGMPMASWNVADPGSRANVVDEIQRAMEVVALPYFELFENPDALASRLEHDEIESFGPGSAIEWLLSRGAREAAIRHAQVVLRDERLRGQYEDAKRNRERGEIPPGRPIQTAEVLAYTALAHGLDF